MSMTHVLDTKNIAKHDKINLYSSSVMMDNYSLSSLGTKCRIHALNFDTYHSVGVCFVYIDVFLCQCW